MRCEGIPMTRAWLMSFACLLSLLAGCGGGGGGGGGAPAAPTPDPLIRYSAQFRYLGLPNNRLTISPVAGESSISTRGVASVQVRANGVLLPPLTAPNVTSSAGQPAFQFDLPPAVAASSGAPCGFPQRLEITVTDAQGFAFKRFTTACSETDFGGFSDSYGHTLTFTITANTPVDGSFGAYSPENAAAGNAGVTVPGASGTKWTAVPASEGDQAFLTATIPAGAPADAQLDLSIESNGVVLARSRATMASLGRTANVSVLCCQGSPTSATASRTVQFVLFPARLNGDNSSPVPYNLHYRVFNTATQQVAQEFAGTPPGPAPGSPDVYTVSVRPGDELALEASPLQAGELVDMYILAPSNGVAQQLGSIVHATVPNVPSLLRVFCCSR
jgi:hypothetical protein